MSFADCQNGFSLSVEDESGARVIIYRDFNKETAKREQTENIRTQLSKLGNTPFSVAKVDVNLSEMWFVPSSLLSDMRREAIEKFILNRRTRYRRELVNVSNYQAKPQFPQRSLTYLGNVANDKSYKFYAERGVEKISPAFEKVQVDDVPLMFTKHCLRYSMGWCPVRQKRNSPY